MKNGDDDYYSKLSGAVTERLKRYGVTSDAVHGFLNQEELRKEIDYLKDQRIPDSVLSTVVSNGIKEALQYGHQRPSITPELVAFTIYDQLRKNKAYGHVAQELIDEGILEGNEAQRWKETIEKRLKLHRAQTGRTTKTLEELLRKAALYAPFAVSVGFLISAVINATYTGAIIGGGEVDFNILLGVGFLLFGLAVHHFSHRS